MPLCHHCGGEVNSQQMKIGGYIVWKREGQKVRGVRLLYLTGGGGGCLATHAGRVDWFGQDQIQVLVVRDLVEAVPVLQQLDVQILIDLLKKGRQTEEVGSKPRGPVPAHGAHLARGPRQHWAQFGFRFDSFQRKSWNKFLNADRLFSCLSSKCTIIGMLNGLVLETECSKRASMKDDRYINKNTLAFGSKPADG